MKDYFAISRKKYVIVYKLYLIYKLVRVHHWIKNIFLFIPLFFAGELFNISKLVIVIAGFLAFNLVASSIYVINDYIDIKFDRLHPKKKSRPLASGELTNIEALLIFLVLLSLGFGLAYVSQFKFFFILFLYFVINIAYTFGLKKVSILDVLLISIGFVLRVKAGGALANIYVTEWLIVMIFLLALFMALGKRMDDVYIKDVSGKEVRNSVMGYNIEFLTSAMTMIAAISLVAYLMYMMSPATEIKFGTHRLYYTFLFLIGGVLRYLQIIYVKKDSGSPTEILYKDKFIQACIFLWIFSYVFIIYFPNFSILEII